MLRPGGNRGGRQSRGKAVLARTSGQAFRQVVTELYTGSARRSVRFRYALILFDVFTILFFILATPFRNTDFFHVTGYVIAVLILLDFAARFWIAGNRRRMLIQVYTLADIIVVIVLFLDPFLPHNFAFLRILRGLRLIHSYQLLGDLRRDSPFFRTHEDAVIAGINLFVFVFLTASAAYAMFFDDRPGVEAYVDALYFTVATLTTTGFGDITLASTGGKLFSVFVMVVGVALFVQLARALFSPSRVRYTCPVCGLNRHDIDAVHCKHCGTTLHIETPGVD